MSQQEKPEKERKRCPGGHLTGTKFGKFKCGNSRCGQETRDLYGGDGTTPTPLAKLEQLDPKDMPFAARKQLALLPDGLKGEAATQWAQEKLVDLLPEAVASIQYDLRYGTDKVRAEAADKVLRANGLDKREAREGGGGLIILQLGDSGAKGIPWLERLNKKE